MDKKRFDILDSATGLVIGTTYNPDRIEALKEAQFVWAPRAVTVREFGKQRFIVATAGDPSVGISGDEAEVVINTSHLDGDDLKDYIKDVKAHLTDAFRALWEFPVSVYTPEELLAENAALEAEEARSYAPPAGTVVDADADPVTAFKQVFPHLYDKMERYFNGLGDPLGEGDWIHLVGRAWDTYSADQLKTLDHDAQSPVGSHMLDEFIKFWENER